MKRIDAANEARQLREQSRSTNLTGEQLFIRSCNSCHPGGKAGVGPSLEELNEHFPKDEDLKKLLRKGSKNMPAQPEATINPTELDNLVVYLHELVNRLNEDKKK